MKTQSIYAYRLTHLPGHPAGSAVRFGGWEIPRTQKPLTERHPNTSPWSVFLLLSNIGFSWALALPALVFPSIKHSPMAQKVESTQIFRPRKFKPVHVQNHPVLSQGQFVFFPSQDGTCLSAWFKAPTANKPVILLAHGRGDNVKTIVPVIEAWMQKGYGVFAVDYRGYGLSQGQPTEHGVYEDLAAASHYLDQQLGFRAKTSQVLMGHSLGGAIAAELASQRPFKAVVLAGTFTSIADQLHYTKHLQHGGKRPLNRAIQITMPDWLIDAIFRSQFETVHKIHRIQSPTLFIHGEDDPIIPKESAMVLFNHSSAPKRGLTILPRQGHDQMSSPKLAPGFVAAVDDFLQTV